MDINAKIREIQRQAMTMGAANWQPAQGSEAVDHNPMAMAFDEVLKKTTVSLDPGLELPPEIKGIIIELMNGKPMDDLQGTIKGLENWARHLTLSPTVSSNPLNQLTASTSYKMVAMALIHLTKQYQSHDALEVLTRLAGEKKMPPGDARWTVDQLKALKKTIKATPLNGSKGNTSPV